MRKKHPRTHVPSLYALAVPRSHVRFAGKVSHMLRLCVPRRLPVGPSGSSRPRWLAQGGIPRKIVLFQHQVCPAKVRYEIGRAHV